MSFKGHFVSNLKERSGLDSVLRMTEREEQLDNERRENEEYKTFDDVSSGTHTYEGDGAEQEEWFRQNSNAYQIIDKMNRSDIEAFKEWTRGTFMWGQQWRGWDNMNTYEQKWTRAIDKALDKAAL